MWLLSLLCVFVIKIFCYIYGHLTHFKITKTNSNENFYYKKKRYKFCQFTMKFNETIISTPKKDAGNTLDSYESTTTGISTNSRLP